MRAAKIALAVGLLRLLRVAAVAEVKDVKDITIGLAFKTHVEKRWDQECRRHKAVFQWGNNSLTTQASQLESLRSQKVAS